MLAIKFKRIGKKHQPSFRLVITEKRSKIKGKFIDDIGWYSPLTKKFNINKEKVIHWLSVGAKPTASVYNLLVKSGTIKGKKIAVHKKSKARNVDAGGEVSNAK